jgi:multidrug efflux system outer membrane protein
LLERRPDIIEAEHRLHAASARIGVAKAAFFPRITLTGAAGLTSVDLSSALNWQSRFWSLGPGISFPTWEVGRNQTNHVNEEARFEETLAAYRGTALNAFREVEEALSDIGTLSSRGDAVRRALVSARDTAALASVRYERGLASYLEVVDAQRAVLQLERAAVQLKGQRVVSTILLAKAVGGGWKVGPTP